VISEALEAEIDRLLDLLFAGDDTEAVRALAAHLAPLFPAANRPAPAPRQFKTAAPAGYLTLHEAGALAGAATETVRFWIWKGLLTAYRPGRSVLVKKDELLGYIASRETVAVRAAKMRKARAVAAPKGEASPGAKVGQRSQRRP
jgi:excisionase family DNA binding protein